MEVGIVREIKEETGLNINEDHLRFRKIYSDPLRIESFPDGNILRLITEVYIIELNKTHKLLCSEESEELKYFSIKELNTINIAETHKHIIDNYIYEELTPKLTI